MMRTPSSPPTLARPAGSRPDGPALPRGRREQGQRPSYKPWPLPPSWNLPPDAWLALSLAAACPDLFALHVEHPAVHVPLLLALRHLTAHERWLILVPTWERCQEFLRHWPPTAEPILILSDGSQEQLNG
ncbi:MAG: hypothetical protein NZ703_09625, partial [Gemmataceae bacterium]|nr:hypothetical protein [Gemmataceae bacterium]